MGLVLLLVFAVSDSVGLSLMASLDRIREHEGQ